jgi:gluconate 2-dehydrogenase gamma chain
VPNDPLRAQLSRRQLLKGAGLVGAAAMATPIGTLVSSPAVAQSPAQGQAAIGRGRVLETLSAAEAETLEAITARLIPSDANGPGALEAQAARYIDRALGGALASSHEAYRSGLAAIDGYARMSKGSPFAKLSAADQDAILKDMEGNIASGFVPDAATFFNLVRAHTIQGTFCDPYYGGNTDFVGWDLIGYPGVRLAVTPNEQRLDPRLMPTHRSAYEHAMFSRKKPARASLEDEMSPWPRT